MFGTKQISKAKNAVKKAAQKAPTPKKPPAPKKVAKAIKKAVPTKAPAKAAKAAGSQLRKAVPKKAVGTRMGGAGYRKFEGDALWLPNTNRPEWLDGSLPGAQRARAQRICSDRSVRYQRAAACARRPTPRAGPAYSTG